MLSHLSKKQLKALAGSVKARDYAAHELIISHGETGVDMFFLNQRGAAAELFDIGVVKTYFPGEFFGEVALLRDQPRGASVRAGSHGATCWVLHRDSFDKYANTTLLESQLDTYTHLYHSLTALSAAEEVEGGLSVTFTHRNMETKKVFKCAGIEATRAVHALRQHQAKLMLQRDIQRHKQKQLLRIAFDIVDESGDGIIDLHELGLLLATLGETLTGAELRLRAKMLDQDGNGTLCFEQFADVRKNHEFCIKNKELYVKNKELCIKNKEFCIKHDQFCR